MRDIGWFGIYYIGFTGMIIACILFTVKNPDAQVWYGEVDFNSRLYSSYEAAQNDHADNIENMHKTFRIWFGICGFNLLFMIFIGIPRHCNRKLGKDSKIVAGIYYLCFFWWLVMWALGLHFRFKEAGRAVCNEANVCDEDAAEPCPDTKLLRSESELIQSSSCTFMKYYLDIAGLLIGGYAAWFILGLTGATKTPVWTPKREEKDRKEK